MKLVDNALDLGLFSDNPDMPAWYTDELGAPPVEVISHSPTYAERFYRLGRSCLKINHSTEPMPQGASGYQELVVARAGIDQPVTLHDPDGLPITLVPQADLDGAELAIVMGVADPGRQQEFFCDALGAAAVPGGVRLGDALFRFAPDPSATRPAPTWSRGFKYYVLFVDDTPASHAELVGGEPSMDSALSAWATDACSRGCETPAATGSSWSSAPLPGAPWPRSTWPPTAGTRSSNGGRPALRPDPYRGN